MGHQKRTFRKSYLPNLHANTKLLFKICQSQENTRTVCQRTPMDDRTDADAYPWGKFHVCWWTEKSPWTIQGIWWLLSRSLCPVVLLVFLHYRYFCGCWRYRDDDCTELWKMTIRLTLGFSLKSVGSFYVVPSEQIRPSVLTDTNVFFLFIHRHQPNLILRPL